MIRRRIGAFVSLVVVANALAATLASQAPAHAQQRSGASSGTCATRALVLSAMPLELDPLLARAHADLSHPIALNGRPYVLGTLEGTRVIMGLTGIGPANAYAGTTDAFSRFRCRDGSPEISDVVFSGTSGGDYIGDVAVPDVWKFDGPRVTLPAWASAALSRGVPTSANLRALMHDGVQNGTIHPTLERSTPPGDPACVCEATDQTQLPPTVAHAPQVLFPAEGLTTDPVAGRTLPCVPTGNDVFGCTPCRELDHDALSQTEALAQQVPPFVSPEFFRSEIQSNTPATPVWQDEETAVVAAVAEHDGASFIGFRAASDGGGDRLMLPGFPSEFFVYRQLAANNAAATALAFLHRLSLST